MIRMRLCRVIAASSMLAVFPLVDGISARSCALRHCFSANPTRQRCTLLGGIM